MNDTTRNVLIVIGIFVLLLLGLSMLGGGMMGGHMFTPEGTENRPWMWGLGMGLGGLMMIIFWGLVIAGIVLLVRQFSRGDSVSGGATPVDVLKRRYAAGEITREQYEQMKRDLEE
jgi:putative membrane protein